MPKQLLIYESVVPVSSGRHRDCFVDSGHGYDFSGHVNSVPLMGVEFAPAASEYAIVFADDAGLMPAVILGVRTDQNLYVSKSNVWEAKYIPAFVRRYPFVFSTNPENSQLVLCIDEAFSGFNREGRGQKLFGDEDKPTPYVENVLRFLQEFQAQYRRTQEFCARLKELDIVEPMQAQIELASGERLALRGFVAVNRAKLKALPAEKLAELAQADELELLFLHLQSMRNFIALRDRLAAVEGVKAPESTPAGEATADAPAPSTNGDGGDGRAAAK